MQVESSRRLDGCFLQHDLEGDAHSIARDLLDGMTEEDRAAWLASTPTDWANKSFAISISPEVGYCVRTGTGCWYDQDNGHRSSG